MTKILVTGAGGFLGSHLVCELLRRGHRVRALVRSVANAHTINELAVEFWEGDLTRPDSVRGCAEGCAAIVHAAALAQANPARDPAMWAVNLSGTKTILAEARRVAIERFVYVGTANVFGFGTLADPGDETRPFAGQRYGSDYMDSKVAATNAVLRAVSQENLPAVLVHPTFMLGPLDAKPTSGQLLLELYGGRLVGYPTGGKNYIYVRDVSTATVNALTMGKIGESYILGNQNLTYRDAFGLMARVLNVPPPRWPLPPALARLYGAICDTRTRLTGRPALVNGAMVAIANDGHYFRADKAIRSLALPQTPIEQAVREAFDWFRTNNYVR
jgi:dihydroflavonol-4-reductase